MRLRVHAFIINLLSTFNFSTLKKNPHTLHIPTPEHHIIGDTNMKYLPNLYIDFYLIRLKPGCF